jgi:hypothetical protein
MAIEKNMRKNCLSMIFFINGIVIKIYKRLITCLRDSGASIVHRLSKYTRPCGPSKTQTGWRTKVLFFLMQPFFFIVFFVSVIAIIVIIVIVIVIMIAGDYSSTGNSRWGHFLGLDQFILFLWIHLRCKKLTYQSRFPAFYEPFQLIWWVIRLVAFFTFWSDKDFGGDSNSFRIKEAFISNFLSNQILVCWLDCLIFDFLNGFL